MKIRDYTNADFDDCVNVFLLTYNHPAINYGWRPERAKAYLKEYLNNSGNSTFVVTDSGQVIAAVFTHIRTWIDENHLYIDELFVHPERQHAGIGKAIISHLEKFCISKECSLIYLTADKQIKSAAFYTRLGFSESPQWCFIYKSV